MAVIITLLTWGFVTGKWVERAERRQLPSPPLTPEDERRVDRLNRRLIERANAELSELTGKVQRLIDMHDRFLVLETSCRTIIRDLERIERRLDKLDG